MVVIRVFLLLGALGGLAGLAWADEPGRRIPGLLFGGRTEPKPHAPPPRIDPLIPRGASFATQPRPADNRVRTCSFRYPLCVQSPFSFNPAIVLGYLSALEQAYERLVWVFDLPKPEFDSAGGTSALDLYLEPALNTALEVARGGVPITDTSGWTRAPAYCVARANASAERTATQCIAEAIAWNLNATATPHTKRAFATHEWWRLGTPSSRDSDAVTAFQQNPHLAVVARDLSPTTEGSALFFSFVERQLAKTHALSAALLALASDSPARHDFQWNNEPDILDVLRSNLPGERLGLAQFFGDFSVARALLGARYHVAAFPDLAWTGMAAEVHIDWTVSLSSLPRRLAPEHPIEPSGAAFFMLMLDEDTSKTTLGFEAEWEAPVSFKWLLVKLGPSGEEISRLNVPYAERATSAHAELSNLSDAKAVLVVGSNIGGVSLSHPFDPDYEPWEPHGVTVHLGKL